MSYFHLIIIIYLPK